jgi:DNA-binding IclR family transcriptional regulator
MPNRDIILVYLRQNDGGCCDDCLSTATNILPRQQVNQICHELERHGLITRKKGYCVCSDQQKIKNRLRGKR